MNICDYGCGQEAKFQLRSGKWCCCESYNKCPEIRRKNSEANKGKQSPLKDRKLSEDHKRKIGLASIGKIPWNKNKIGIFSEEALLKISNNSKKTKANLGRNFSEEWRKNIGKFWKGKKRVLSEEAKKNMLEASRRPEVREKLRQRMLNGGAVTAIKGIKKISKPELKLRDIIQSIYPECEFQYKVLNYSLDVALVENKIAIEFDGYYHFNCEENIEYHKKRKEKIELDGWKFIQYTIFQKFPTKEQLEKDIQKLLGDLK